MKHRYILLTILILFTSCSCKDDSNILSSKNIADINQVKEFDKHLKNNALISDGYYRIKTSYSFLAGNLKDIKYTIQETELKAKIEIDEDSNCIIKCANGTSFTPKSELNSYSAYRNFYTYNENIYIRTRYGDSKEDRFFYFNNKTRVILRLPFPICENLEHAINYYSYPVPTTYINSNQIYLQENYKINIDESNGYLYAKYSNNYEDLIHLEMNTKYYESSLTSYAGYAYLLKLTLDKIEPFVNEKEPEQLDLYSNIVMDEFKIYIDRSTIKDY